MFLLRVYHINTFSFLDVLDSLSIGRNEGDLVIPDPLLSGKHFKIFTKENLLYIQDLGSRNHTSVNRREIDESEVIELKPNYLIEAGIQKFVLTDKRELSIEQINLIVDPYLAKPLITLDNTKSILTLRDKVHAEMLALTASQKQLETVVLHAHERSQLLQQQFDQIEIDKKLQIKKLEEEIQYVELQARNSSIQIQSQQLQITAEIEVTQQQIKAVEEDIKAKLKRIDALSKNLK